MRPSSSHTTSTLPRDDPHQDGNQQRQPARQPSRLLDQQNPPLDSDSDTDSDTPNRHRSSQHRAAALSSSSAWTASAHSDFLSRHVGGPSSSSSSSSSNTVLMTAAASADGPGASSTRPSHNPQHPPRRPNDTQTDVDMYATDSQDESDSDESDTELESGGAPLTPAAPIAAHHATIPHGHAHVQAHNQPSAGSDSDYLSDADQDYDDDDDDDEEEGEVEEEQAPGVHFQIHSHPNTLPPIAPPAPMMPHPANNAFFFNHLPPGMALPMSPAMPSNMQGIPVPPAHFMPTGPTDLANLPPLPQPHPGWMPVPPGFGMGFDQNIDPSNANPHVLGAENLGLVDFLRDWAYQGLYGRARQTQPPLLEELLRQAREQPDEIDFSQLNGDQYDLQGLDWTSMETTRKAARLRRQYTYRNYVNRNGSDKWMSQDVALSSRESFFRFKRMNIRKDVCLAHFQLRSVLACPTRTHAYYPTAKGVARMNLASRKSDICMSLRDFPTPGSTVSTVDAGCGVLMCGTFNGDYCIKALDSPDKAPYAEGRITSDPTGITNHIKIHTPRRSCGPAAAIASNDHGFRLLDLETQKIVQERMYPFALNCTAVSPDRRLRVVVGDHFNVHITNADTGEVLRELGGHRDYGFACDWSDDGWTVATGFQDMAVKIWDARHWCNSSGKSTPLCTIRTEMAGARSLRFSPLGSGPPVLVAAEEADFVNVIDARTFRYKQEIDVFGEIGGVSFANDGQDLNVLCCDTHRGGLLQLQRCRGRYGFMRPYDDEALSHRHSWLPDTDTTPAMHEIPAFF